MSRFIRALFGIVLAFGFVPLALAAPNCSGTVLNTNGSFETPNKGAAVTWYSEPAGNVTGWTSTSSAIEIWANGFNAVTPYDGTQIAEMNWNAADTLTTNAFTVQKRAELLVYWAHRGRAGSETANLQIQTAAGAPLLNYGNFTTGTGAWVLRNTNTVMGLTNTSVRLQLQSISPTGGVGNLLDSVEACQTYITLGKTLHNRIDNDASGNDSAGDTLTYQFTVSNPAGNARTLTGLQIVDDKIGTVNATSYLTSGDGNSNGQLDVGETWIVRVPYTVTQNNMDAASVTNTAYAQANTPNNLLRSDDAVLTTPLTTIPSLQLAKTAWRAGVQLTPSTPVSAGDIIEYRFNVTNSGNVTVSGIGVNETGFNGTGTPPVPLLSVGTTTLGPGQTALWTANYIVTQTDIDTLQ